MTKRRKIVLGGLAALVLAFAAYSYSWTYTPYGRLDYRAAFSLHVLSFDYRLKPDPDMDFEISLPINLVYSADLLAPEEPVAATEDLVIPGEGGDIPARLYRPRTDAAIAGPRPLIVYFHGGGFVVGSVDQFDRLTRSLANATGALVLSVDYRLAPRHPFPAAIDDAMSAFLWSVEHAATFGSDPSRVVVGGDSAGGNLAAVTALRARDAGGPVPAAQLLYYPVLDLTAKVYPSVEKFADGYGLSTASKTGFNAAYVGHVTDRSDPAISPVYAASVAGLAPALVATAGFDPLSDSTALYVERLKGEGTPVLWHNFPKTIHGFMGILPFPERAESLVLTRRFLEQLFRTEADAG